MAIDWVEVEKEKEEGKGDYQVSKAWKMVRLTVSSAVLATCLQHACYMLGPVPHTGYIAPLNPHNSLVWAGWERVLLLSPFYKAVVLTFRGREKKSRFLLQD